jgi:hypothetical protein
MYMHKNIYINIYTCILPIGIALAALSPPTIALACAADLNDLYFNIKYTAPGRVPSQGEALPTLMINIRGVRWLEFTYIYIYIYIYIVRGG